MATVYDPAAADVGELVKVAAADLVIDPNVRTDIRLDKSFISSIRQYGFEQYPVGWRDDDGHVHITMGQRRVSAALEIGWTLVPIVIKPRQAAEGDRAEELRILRQLRENEQRAELTTTETTAAYNQLALFGVTEDQIARKTNSPKQKVSAALKVAGSKAATDIATAQSLTLDQAAIIAEFDGDETATTELSTVAAEDPEQIPHVAQRLREDRLDQEVIDRLADEIRAAGATPLRNWAERDEAAPRAEYLSHLCRADDPDRKPLTVDDIDSLTDVYGWIRPGYRGDADRGFKTDWMVDKWKSQGLAQRYRAATVPQTDEDKEAERERKRARREAKAAMRAATVVRREWLRDTLLARGARYDTTHRRYIAAAMLHAVGHLNPTYGSSGTYLSLELLGIEDTYDYFRDPITGHFVSDPTANAWQKDLNSADPIRVALAAAIARTETVVGNEKADDFGQDLRAARYLMQLSQWGYTLADVEQAIVTAAEEAIERHQAEDADDEDEADDE